MPANFDRIYDEHAQALFGFLLNLLRNEQDTRDVLQEIFIKLGRHPELLDKAKSERLYLLGLAHNAAIDLIRRRSARDKYHEALGVEPCATFMAAGDPDEVEFRRQIEAALAELPADQRSVVHLKLWNDLTFEEIAAALEIPLNTAASRYRYGLDKLRDHLRPLYDEIK